jgi:alkanesulfonate monooxygenase SsuD/methylene tetrahydromethanopterin reductase-like flavin-dependent oxidoreductase (luciferase family)
MRYGFVAPFVDAQGVTELAELGERQGWDGIFLAESVWGTDAWVALGAAAMVSERIRLGTLLTPVPRWKPWDLASRVGTVDRLSGGRAILSAGLGALHDGWLAFEADEGRRTRAEKLDEGLAVYDGLMRGQPYSFDGRHYTVQPTTFFPPDPTVQRPRPPVWLVGAYVVGSDRQPSLDRAARWDGLLPQVIDREERSKGDSIEVFAEVVEWVRERRAGLGLVDQAYDVVVEGDLTGEFVQRTPAQPAIWEQAGATWWIESWWTLPAGPEGYAELRRRVAAGPPPS